MSKNKKLTIRITEQQLKMVCKFAIQEGISKSSLVRKMIDFQTNFVGKNKII
jgi:predicted DNA binding CopG/RHH family protein